MQFRHASAGSRRINGPSQGWLRRALCGLHGHDMLLSYEPGRICLRCALCSYETPGWVLKVESIRPEGNLRGPRAAVFVEQNAR
jgi:hypothetical protein